VVVSGPEEITNWEPGERVPLGYHRERRLRHGFIIGGALPFAILYTVSIFVAATLQADSASTGGTNNANLLYIPGIGPFLAPSSTGCPGGCVDNRALFIVDGLGQCTGLAMLVAGVTVRRTILVRDRPRGVGIVPMPFVGTHGAGLSWIGTF
jgi:hypothetical protein